MTRIMVAESDNNEGPEFTFSTAGGTVHVTHAIETVVPAPADVTVDVAKELSGRADLIVTVHAQLGRWFRLRLWLGTKLVRLAAAVMGLRSGRVEFDYDWSRYSGDRP